MPEGDRPEQLQELVDKIDESKGVVALLLQEDEGVQTFFWDADASDITDPSLSTATLLTSAGRDFLEQLEGWAIQESAQRGNAAMAEEDASKPIGNRDDFDPESPEYQ